MDDVIKKFKVFTRKSIDNIEQFRRLPEETKHGISIATLVFPFKINQYVVDNLIDWDNWRNDPMFALLFPQRDMLSSEDFEALSTAVEGGSGSINDIVRNIRKRLNPHSSGQMELNVPVTDNGVLDGIQHKYSETVLFFPQRGQTCHSYCSFCFRWAQFIGDKELQFASKDTVDLIAYLRNTQNVTDLLITGGDPLVMSAKNLKSYILPVVNDPKLKHISTIRIGTKSLSFWPYRYVTDKDSDELLHLFRDIVGSGKKLAIMTHFNHWKELEPNIVTGAIQAIRSTGADIYGQGPLIKGINDNAEIWSRLWRRQTELGISPYYMFIERDTGACNHFEVPLVDAWKIYQRAISNVSGLSRTARGPVMSATLGKVEVQGVTEIKQEKVFVLRFIQARCSDWVQIPFFAKYDEKATWFDDLKPAFGEKAFFFEKFNNIEK